MNCVECKLCKSCHKCLKRKTQIKYYSTETTKRKRQPPFENGYMLPHYIGEETENVFVEEKEIVQASYKKVLVVLLN